MDIVNYFVYGVSAYTCDEFRAVKSLNAYKLFVAGWVREIKFYRPNACPNIVVTGKLCDPGIVLCRSVVVFLTLEP